jgi:dCTP deaminase
MILTDREISIALENRQIIIDPLPDSEAFSSTSVDLCLADRFVTWTTQAGVPIQPGAQGFSYASLGNLQSSTLTESFSLDRHAFVLAWTKELIELPVNARLAARVEGKSFLARLGIGVHITGPTIHSGFKGQIQLEICNLGPRRIILDAGMKICQLIFELTLGTPGKGYQGAFAGQSAGS